MKSKSILRRLEQLEKKVLPPKQGGDIVVIVQPDEVIDRSLYEGYDMVTFIIEDQLPD